MTLSWPSSSSLPLPLEDYKRYGRQMILEGVGLEGQVKLHNASVVVVGAGGLGCPALQYLGAAGVGRIGIIDGDTVELSNLQRQILHSEESVGQPKAESAARALQRLNSHLKIDIIAEHLTPSNALSLLKPYDLILDCTDNAPTRYLLSDSAVGLGKPLVSGAAQKLEGQLSVYNWGRDGPCYRCLFPKPPAQETVGSCEEVGVLGGVTGIIGNLQALETIKIIVGLAEPIPTLLLYNALSLTPFRSIKLRKRKPTCPACGTEGQRVGEISQVDYVQFCGGPRPDWVARGLAREEKGDARIDVKDFKDAVDRDATQESIRVIDVRPPTEFGICHLPCSINVPLSMLVASPSDHLPTDSKIPVYVVCRLGNDSQIAVEALRSARDGKVGSIQDIIGGLRAWSKEVDPGFPVY